MNPNFATAPSLSSSPKATTIGAASLRSPRAPVGAARLDRLVVAVCEVPGFVRLHGSQ